MDEHTINMILIFLGSAFVMYEINYLIWSIQESRKPKRAKINTDVFKTFKHRKKDQDSEEKNEE